jgi:flagellar basal body rod protein FlgG
MERSFGMSDFEQGDRYLEKSLDNLRDVVTEGFKNIDKKFDNMVTRDLFSATVQRIDSDIHSTNNSIEFVEKTVEDRIDALDRKLESSGNRTRWVIGLAIVVAGIISGIVFSVINLLSP